MSCTLKGHKSIFGESPKITYIYADMIKERLKRNYEVLLIDCLDGLCLMPFARKNLKVYGYETNRTYLYGGILDVPIGQTVSKQEIIGLKGRLENESIKDNVYYYNKNYYLENTTKKYDFVFVYKSLHKNSNKDISMKDKINKILNSVSDNGYVFIYYYLAIDEKDFYTYPSNQYLRTLEMTSFFNKEWEIIDCKEWKKIKLSIPNPDNLEDHKYRKGIIFARKVKSNKYKEKHKFHYKLNMF